ncbi:hypothetical protein D3C75_972500 [compost metagenome]
MIERTAQQLAGNAPERLNQQDEAGILHTSAQLIEYVHGYERPHERAAGCVNQAGNQEYFNFLRIGLQKLHILSFIPCKLCVINSSSIIPKQGQGQVYELTLCRVTLTKYIHAN